MMRIIAQNVYTGWREYAQIENVNFALLVQNIQRMINRRKETWRIIKKRLRQIYLVGGNEQKVLNEPHRLAKRRAFGCSRSHCAICHPNKYKNIKKNENDYYTA